MDVESEEEEVYSSGSLPNIAQIIHTEPVNQQNENKKKKITNDQWSKELQSKMVNKNELNLLIANHLYIKGLNQPLKTFIQEAKINFEYDENFLNKRFLISDLIRENKIADAINEINLINKEIFEKNKTLLFILKRQNLLSYIKDNKIQEALNFAKSELLPLTKDNKELYTELENTMSLLAYENINDAPEKEFFTDAFREKLADITNLTLLYFTTKNQPNNSNLEMLIKLMLYVQEQLKSEIDFPQILTICPLTFSSVK